MAERQRLIRLVAIEAGACLLLTAGYALVFRPVAAVPGSPSATASAALEPAVSPTAAEAPETLAPETMTPLPAGSATPVALSVTVSADGDNLRLRASPGPAGTILGLLTAGEPLTAVGRTPDASWIEIYTFDQRHGWVLAEFVDLPPEAGLLPVTGLVITPTPDPDGPYITMDYARAREIFLAGKAVGNRANAFALVGDSNTDNPAFLAPFDAGRYNLGNHALLQATIDFFRGSFGRHSPAAVGSFNTAKVLDPNYADNRCGAGETPLACEYRLQQPALALILLGTGDQHAWQTFEQRYRTIIEYTITRGILPVLMTKADDLEHRDSSAASGFINSVIVRLSAEYRVPLLDLNSAVDTLPDRGLKPDGFHFNSPPDGLSADFTGGHLDYGFTVRNLTALQILDVLRQQIFAGS